MFPKSVFLLNPTAGGRGCGSLRADLLKAFGPIDLVETRSREDVMERARKALAGGTEMVVAVGGDGTVNAAVQGFFTAGKAVRADAMLGVIGCGTGSDYVRSLGFARSWREYLATPRPNLVDVGGLEAGGAEERFVNMASFGMSAVAVAGKNRAPFWQPKVLRYLIPTVAAAVQEKPQPVRVTLDGRLIERPLLALLIAKGRYAGGGMRLSHGAMDDGFFTVTLVGALAPLTVLANLHRIYNGRLGAIPGIEQVQARRVSVETAVPWPYEIDGEVRAPVTRADVSLLPRSLSVAT